MEKDNKGSSISYKRKEEWIDFNLKIQYIYEVLFNKDKEKLINYFSDQTAGLSNKNNRKKTIENWLKGNIKKANRFNISRFKISEYKYGNGEPLFTYDSFKSWRIDEFRKRVDDYMAQLDKKKEKGNRLQYIYYYNLNSRAIDYYYITYPDPNNLSKIYLESSQLKEEMTYKGEIFEYHNMLYIFVKNDFDYMIYIVENSANIFSKKIKVYGTGQCKDYLTKQPKVYLSLFSSTKLTPDEEEKYKHQLNNSNLLIAQNFPKNCVLPQDYMFYNFFQKLHILWRDISDYEEIDFITNREYNEIIIKKFKSYINIIKKASQNFDFFISTYRKIRVYSLGYIPDSELETGVIFIYTLNQATLPFLYKVISNQIESLELHNVYLRCIIIVEEKEALTSGLIEKLRELESKNVDVRLSSKNPTIYSEIFITIDTNFSLYRIGTNVEDCTYVTNQTKKINDLYQAQEMLIRYALPMDNFLDSQCSLNGKWFCYSYSSKHDSSFFHTIPIEIQNNNIVAYYSTGVSVGKVYHTPSQAVLILEDSIIKIQNQYLHDNIFKVSIIGKELYIDNRDLLIYGIMSREELKSDEVHMLLSSIHIKDDYDFRLKMSDRFDTLLAEFKAKRVKECKK